MIKNNTQPTIDDIHTIDTNGEWNTKSGGTLNILYKIDYSILRDFLNYDQSELDKIPTDIRGLRSYKVIGIHKDSIGANEWHKIRNEIVYCLSGSFKWTCTDLYGNTREFILNKNTAVFTPHHILHTYQALEDNSSISVTANTLFDPNDQATQDTYPASTFSL